MATVTIEQDVVVVKDPAKCKEICDALASEYRAFPEIKPTSCQPTKEQKEFIEKWFCRSNKTKKDG